MNATSRDQEAGQLDPVIEAAPPEGWRRWASELGHYDKDRIAGFGGFIAGGFLVGVVCLYVFAWLTDEVMSKETTALDNTAFTYVHQFSSPTMDTIMRALSFMGSEAVLIIGVLLLLLFLAQRRWGAAVILVVVTVGAQLLNNVLKAVFHRTRPAPVDAIISAQQWSFPSGHAMVSAAFYFYIAYLCWRIVPGVWRYVLAAALTLLVLLIGISRIYLQAHYLSDVIAGYLVGFLWTEAIIIGSQLLVTRRIPRLPGQRTRPPSNDARDMPTEPDGSTKPAHTLNG
ncbi:MAG TPA: phosphatase PAP2 family protein [Chloroflexota bacterium]